MSASWTRTESTRAILLATLAASIVSILVSAGALRWISAASDPDPVPAAIAAHAVSHPAPIVMPDTVVARSTCEASASPSLASPHTPSASSAIVRVTRARERDLRAAYAALELAQPGALDAGADALLSGDGPTAQKVALLRALRDTRSATVSRWLDVTVRSAAQQDDPNSQALQAFALEQLTELALLDADACQALGDLAFDAADVAIDVRRRASAGFAAACSTDRLPELSRRLFREPDELIIASAVSALESRRSVPEVQRLLALHGRAPPESSTHEAEPAN